MDLIETILNQMNDALITCDDKGEIQLLKKVLLT